MRHDACLSGGMRYFLFSLLAAASLAACTSRSEPTAADNTARNKTDSTKPTADQAAQGGTDLDLTQQVRKAIVAEDGLSTNATNVKIVVDKGVVTLVGPVESTAERTRLVQLAQRAGAKQVVDQLELNN
jgi:osmotically-inducible protein OsmY